MNEVSAVSKPEKIVENEPKNRVLRSETKPRMESMKERSVVCCAAGTGIREIVLKCFTVDTPARNGVVNLST